MKKRSIVLFSFILLLQACGTTTDSGHQKNQSSGELPHLQAEVKEGDFTYKLYSEKESYKEFEDIEVYAELIYTGQEDSIEISHAASPFSFPFEEMTRGYEVPYAMDVPLIITTIKKNEPLRKKYAFAGGFSDQDDSEYVRFVKTVMSDGFPEGNYIIHGSADFGTITDSGEQAYHLKADIGFTVRK